MPEQQGSAPAAKAGILLDNDWGDYKTPQEFFVAMAAKLEISIEAGKTGATGDQGDAGDPAPAIKYSITKEKTVNVPNGATYVDAGQSVEGRILILTAPDGASDDPGDAVAVGHLKGTVAHFVFGSNISAVPELGWKLEIYYLGEDA